MSIQHRIRAVRDRTEERAAGVKRGPRPAEFQRASELDPVPHERAPASARVHAEAPAAAPAKPKAKAKRKTRRR